MGKAALAMANDRPRLSEEQLERVGIWQLREMARQNSSEYQEAAARVFVRRALEMASEWLTDYRHANTGFHPFSPAALLGEQPGGSTRAADPLLIHYQRAERHRDAHRLALAFIGYARLSPRQLLAVLIQARKLDRRHKGSEWAASYDKIAADVVRYARQLGFGAVLALPPEPVRDKDGLIERVLDEDGEPTNSPRWEVPGFKNGEALKSAAKRARVQLILLAKL